MPESDPETGPVTDEPDCLNVRAAWRRSIRKGHRGDHPPMVHIRASVGIARRVATLLTPAIFCAGLVSGCGGGKEAAAAGVERARVLDQRIESIQREVDALPRETPHQMAAYTRITSQFSACQVVYRAKEKTRLGSVPEPLFRNVSGELDSIEELIARYPR